MTRDDLEAVDELRRVAGWNQRPEDWSRMLASAPRGCFLAEDGGRVVGSVTTTTYAPTLAWLGMMLVHPQYRGQGLGTALMKHALEYLKGRKVACVKLDATPAGLPLYQRLGFVSEWTLQRWQLSAEARAAPGRTLSGTRNLRSGDWSSIEKLDNGVLGVSRLKLLQSLARESVSTRAWPDEGPIAGWGMLRAGANADYLGPLICESSEGALALVTALLVEGPRTAVYWDIPDLNETAGRLAQQLGFQPVRPLTRMRLGPDSGLGGPRFQLGIADPALG